MVKLIINNYSDLRKSIFKVNFFLDEKKIRLNKKQEVIENISLGEHKIKVANNFFVRSSEHSINISKNTTVINISNTKESIIIRAICSIIYLILLIFIIFRKNLNEIQILGFFGGYILIRVFYTMIRKTLEIKVSESDTNE